MHDQTNVIAPDALGQRAFQKRRDDQVRRECFNRFLGHAVSDVVLDRHVMAALRQCDVEPLRKTIEAAREKQDTHD
jgi:hypothetical protein